MARPKKYKTAEEKRAAETEAKRRYRANIRGRSEPEVKPKGTKSTPVAVRHLAVKLTRNIGLTPTPESHMKAVVEVEQRLERKRKKELEVRKQNQAAYFANPETIDLSISGTSDMLSAEMRDIKELSGANDAKSQVQLLKAKTRRKAGITTRS